jgi:hypothetical protein
LGLCLVFRLGRKLTPNKFVRECGAKGDWKRRILVVGEDGGGPPPQPIGDWLDCVQLQPSETPKTQKGRNSHSLLPKTEVEVEVPGLLLPKPKASFVWRREGEGGEGGGATPEDWEWGWPLPNAEVTLRDLWPALQGA